MVDSFGKRMNSTAFDARLTYEGFATQQHQRATSFGPTHNHMPNKPSEEITSTNISTYARNMQERKGQKRRKPSKDYRFNTSSITTYENATEKKKALMSNDLTSSDDDEEVLDTDLFTTGKTSFGTFSNSKPLDVEQKFK